MDAQMPLSARDLVSGLLALLVVLGGALVYYAGVRRTPHLRLYMAALSLKLLACFVYSLLIVLYFPGGGDSLVYHREGVIGAEVIRNDLFWGSRAYLDSGLFFMPGGSSTAHMQSLSALIHLLTFDSYLAASVFFAVLGFAGQLLLYRTFTERYPDPRLGVWWKAGILFFPTLTFWSSGMLKDSVGMWGLGLAVWGTHRALRDGRALNYLFALLGIYALIQFRLQVVPVLLIALVPWALQTQSVRSRLHKMRVQGRRTSVRIALVATGVVGIWMAGKLEPRFMLSRIPEAIARQSGLFEHVGGATTTVIAVPTWSGLIASAPLALVLSLFRPFPWEASGILGLFAAAENVVILVLVARMVVQLFRHRGLAGTALHAPMFVTCLLFVLLFGVALGASTPNLGSISRYRLPLIPFLVGMLAIVESRRLERTDSARARERLRSGTGIEHVTV